MERKIVHRLISVPCTESLPRLPTLKSLGLLKASGSQFPASKETCEKQRKFLQEWLVKYPWLVYSKYLDGAFCLPCVCFGMECGKNGAKVDKLFRSPLTFWATARGKFDSHASGKSEIHKFSVKTSLMEKFILVETSHEKCWIHPCLKYPKMGIRYFFLR